MSTYNIEHVFSYFTADVVPVLLSDTTRRGSSFVAGWSGLWLHLGASYIDVLNYETQSTRTTDRSAYGIFGALRGKDIPYLERLTYLFEWDRRRDEFIYADRSRATEDADIYFNELNYLVRQGINLKLRYESYEPDKDSSDSERKRYVVGVDFHPFPFLELNLQYRFEEEEPETDNDQILFIAHIWF